MSPPFSKTWSRQPWAVQLPGISPPGSIVAFQIPRKEKPAGYPFFLFLSFSLSNHIADPALADTFVTFSIMLANTIQPDLVFL